jgi:BolA protein
MEINSLIKVLKEKLIKEIKINNIKIEDKSFLHKKHQNFDKNKFHIKLIIESSELKKISSIEANKIIYGILKDEMNNNIHSLQIIIV